jgi:hypothetical protein
MKAGTAPYQSTVLVHNLTTQWGSGDLRSVRIYGHYPMIDNKGTTFYRHPIHEFSFAALDGIQVYEERLRPMDADPL